MPLGVAKRAPVRDVLSPHFAWADILWPLFWPGVEGHPHGMQRPRELLGAAAP